MKKLASIVVLNYNGEKFIEPCLSSVFKSNYPNFEVILVDNGSTDNSIKIAREKFGKDPRLRIILNHKNLGFAEGNNVGIGVSKGDYIVLLSNDTKVHPNWLKELIGVIESNEKIGAAQPKLLLMHKPNYINSIGVYIDFFSNPFRRNFPGEKDRRQYENIIEVFMGAAIALALRRDVLEEVGVFDEDFFIYAEDLDLCWRIWLAGYKVVYVPKAVVYHKGAATIKSKSMARAKERPPFEFHYYKNHLMCLLKNYELKNLIKTFPGYIFGHLALILFGSFKRKQSYLLKDFFKAIFWIILNFKSIWRKRLEVQQKIRKKSDDYLLGKVIKNTSQLIKNYARKKYYLRDITSRFLESRQKF